MFIESLSFSFFFFYLAKNRYAKCKLLSSNRKTIFIETYTIQCKMVFISLLISKSTWHNFPEKYLKVSVFLATPICSRLTLTSLCTIICRSSLRRLVFAIVIDSALMPPLLVKKVTKDTLMRIWKFRCMFGFI